MLVENVHPLLKSGGRGGYGTDGFSCPCPAGRTVKSLSNCNMGVSMIPIGVIGSSRMGKLWDKGLLPLLPHPTGLIPRRCWAAGSAARTCLVTGVSVVLAAMPMGGVTAWRKSTAGIPPLPASVAVSTVLSHHHTAVVHGRARAGLTAAPAPGTCGKMRKTPCQWQLRPKNSRYFWSNRRIAFAAGW